MILYYALGGGLGHLSRSLAILERFPPRLRDRCRLLVSSQSAGVVIPFAPCPVDRVPPAVMARRENYFSFFTAYLQTHRFTRIVADTFPFGLLGELRREAGDIPRILVGRYLRWESYAATCDTAGRWPDAAVLLEEQEPKYREELERRGKTVSAPGPVSLFRDTAPASHARCCIVHSGNQAERKVLTRLAREIMAERGMACPLDVIVPELGLYPLERHLARYTDVVAGAGYAACAMAALARGSVRFHLTPFLRRYDDQARRLRKLQEGLWRGAADSSAADAAAAVKYFLENLAPQD